MTCIQAMVQVVNQVRVTVHPGDGGAAVDLGRVVDTALQMLDPGLRSRGEFVRDVAAHPPVRGNEGQLCQVLINLVSNAFQALDPAGGRPCRVTVRVRPDGGRVVCCVEDTGCGIDAAHRERMFMPFFTTNSRGEGTGMGLSISKTIVQGHGGSIDFESVPGQGSTFRLAFPVADTAGPG